MFGGPQFKVGSIIRFTYTKSTRDRYKEVFVLHSNWEGKVHAIDMRRLTEAERLVLRTVMNPKAKGKRHRIPLINDILARMDPVTLVDEPMAFYNQFVKVFLRNKDAYRTYWPNFMSGVQVVNQSDADIDRPMRPVGAEPLFKKV